MQEPEEQNGCWEIVSSIHEMEAAETTPKQGLCNGNTSWRANTDEGLLEDLTIEEELQAINDCLERENQSSLISYPTPRS